MSRHVKGRRPVRVKVNFSHAEARALDREGERTDRSMVGVVHWIVRQWLRGELTEKARRGLS